MTHSRPDRRRAASVAAFVGVLALVTASSAAAHTELVGSTPAEGATMATSPAEVVLEFSQPVQTQFAQVAVLDAGGGHHEKGEPQVDGATVTQDVDELVPGTHRISYRVGSADGHPVTGTLTFTVTATPAATTEPATPAPHKASSEATPDPHEGMDHGERTPSTAAAEAGEPATSTSTLVMTGGGIVVAAMLGVGLYVLVAGRRSREPGETDL
jgi:copper resistance protein C